ncbi:MAG: phage tail sheath subtilisin-like domain-containing protein [Pseudomonadota bacterium]
MLTIPGVEITVVKELVPRGLGAAGVLGIVGCAERSNVDDPLREVSSLSEFRELFGAGSVASMPEVELAFSNGLKALVCAAVDPNAGLAAGADAAFDLFDAGGATQAATLRVRARASGVWGNDLHVRLVTKGAGAAKNIDVLVYANAADARANKPAETFRNLSPDTTDARFFLDVVNAESGFIALPANVPPFAVGGSMSPANANATAPASKLAGGFEPTVAEFSLALERLESQRQVDMVIASNRIADNITSTELASAVISHCERMSRKAANRIGLGQIPPHGTSRPDIPAAAAMAAALTSDRFVLTAPSGYVGAVAGLLSKQSYFQSPTFKTLRGIAAPNYDFSDGDLRALLNAGLLPIDTLPRKGVAVVKGIATSQYQINVQRTADRAVRTVQNIAIDYVGLLNNQAQRSALRQRIDEAFNAMTREGALVPSADGLSPPYEVEVTATNADAAAGIVRIGIAVRPVRAIDYIYATINVRAF